MRETLRQSNGLWALWAEDKSSPPLEDLSAGELWITSVGWVSDWTVCAPCRNTLFRLTWHAEQMSADLRRTAGPRRESRQVDECESAIMYKMLGRRKGRRVHEGVGWEAAFHLRPNSGVEPALPVREHCFSCEVWRAQTWPLPSPRPETQPLEWLMWQECCMSVTKDWFTDAWCRLASSASTQTVAGTFWQNTVNIVCYTNQPMHAWMPFLVTRWITHVLIHLIGHRTAQKAPAHIMWPAKCCSNEAWPQERKKRTTGSCWNSPKPFLWLSHHTDVQFPFATSVQSQVDFTCFLPFTHVTGNILTQAHVHLTLVSGKYSISL